MEFFDKDIPYLHEENAPRQIVDIMRPTARFAVRSGLGYEASHRYLDMVATDLAQSIVEIDAQIEAPAVDARVNAEPVVARSLGSEITSAVTRLALTLWSSKDASQALSQRLEQSITSRIDESMIEGWVEANPAEEIVSILEPVEAASSQPEFVYEGVITKLPRRKPAEARVRSARKETKPEVVTHRTAARPDVEACAQLEEPECRHVRLVDIAVVPGPDWETELIGAIDSGQVARERLTSNAGGVTEQETRELQAAIRKGRRAEDRFLRTEW
jgi:hypothetical protein